MIARPRSLIDLRASQARCIPALALGSVARRVHLRLTKLGVALALFCLLRKKHEGSNRENTDPPSSG